MNATKRFRSCDSQWNTHCYSMCMKLPPALTVCSVLLSGGCSANGGGFATSPPPVSPPPDSTPKATSAFRLQIPRFHWEVAVQFTATVANLSNTAVSWAVNGAMGGDLSVRSDLKQRALHRAGRSASTSYRHDFGDKPERAIRLRYRGLTITSDIIVGLAPVQMSLELGAHKHFLRQSLARAIPTRPSFGV